MTQLELYFDAIKNNLRLASRVPIILIGDLALQLADDIKLIFPAHQIFTSPRDIDQVSCIIYIDSASSSMEINRLIADMQIGSMLVVAGATKSFLQAGDIKQIPFSLTNKGDPELFENYHIQPLFKEPLGKLSEINRYKNNRLTSLLVSKVGVYMPTSQLYSPYSLFIYKKMSRTASFHTYKKRTSINARLSRVKERFGYKLANHRIHDYYSMAIAFIRSIPYIGEPIYTEHLLPSIKPSKRKSKKSIVFVTGHLAIGGVERVLLNILTSLPRDAYYITIYTTTWNANKWTEAFTPYADEIIHIPSLLGHKWPRKYTARFLRDSLTKNKPDILFITNSDIGYKILPDIQESAPDYVLDLLHTHGTPKERDAFLRISEPYDRYIDKRVVISTYLKNYLIDNYKINKSKIDVIYNGIVDTSLPSVQEINKAKKFLNWNKDHKYITYLGRLQSDKSPSRLLHIAREMEDALLRKNIYILVIGEGNMKDTLVEQAETLGLHNKTIKFFPFTEIPSAVAKLSQYTIITSDLEGIPMSALESMHVGTPVISTAVGGVPEIITHAANGYLVNIEDRNEAEIIEEFRRVINIAINISDTEKKAMGLRAQKTVTEKFTAMSDKYEKLFREAASSSH